MSSFLLRPWVILKEDSLEVPVCWWWYLYANYAGPGCSSIGGGMLSELGPFYPTPDGTHLQQNPNSWNKGKMRIHHGTLFLSLDLSLWCCWNWNGMQDSWNQRHIYDWNVEPSMRTKISMGQVLSVALHIYLICNGLWFILQFQTCFSLSLQQEWDFPTQTPAVITRPVTSALVSVKALSSNFLISIPSLIWRVIIFRELFKHTYGVPITSYYKSWTFCTLLSLLLLGTWISLK